MSPAFGLKLYSIPGAKDSSMERGSPTWAGFPFASRPFRPVNFPEDLCMAKKVSNSNAQFWLREYSPERKICSCWPGMISPLVPNPPPYVLNPLTLALVGKK